MFTLTFWKDLAERAVSTSAESLGAVLGTAGLGLLESDWKGAVSVAGMAGVIAALKALGASQLNGPYSASLIDLPGRHSA